MKKKLLSALGFVASLLIASCSLVKPKTSVSASAVTSASSVASASASPSASPSVSSASASASASTKPAASKDFTLYSFNDFHGSYEQYNGSGYNEVGAARLKYAIEHDGDYQADSSMILSAGDSYQGSYLAYYDRELASALLGKIGVKAMALGNHEWDWGVDALKEMIQQDSPNFPVLACNVLLNETGKPVDFLTPSTIVTTASGVKVGIVGAIGSGEESDIKTSIIETYSFSPAVSYVEAELKKMSDCDYKIFLVHDSINDSSNTYVKDIITSLQSDGYGVDAVVGGHTHQFEAETYQGVPFVQGGHNSLGYGKIVFNSTSHTVTPSYTIFDAKDYNVPDSALDSSMLTLIQQSTVVQGENKGLGITFDDIFNRYDQMYQFIPDAMLYEAKKEGWGTKNPIIAIHNVGGIRDSLAAGEATPSRLFKVCPFDNKARAVSGIPGSVIAQVIGSTPTGRVHVTGKSTESLSYCYDTSDGLPLDSTKTYDVLTIDYCYEKSYFSKIAARANWLPLKKATSTDWVMPDLIRDYVVNSGTTTFKKADYTIYSA